MLPDMPNRIPPEREERKESRGLLGIGLDGDGETRITTGKDFLLLGGSHETHERMQDVVIRMNERLKRRGKTYAQLSRSEFEDLARESLE